MAKIVRGGLIQTSVTHEGTAPLDEIKKAMIEKHMRFLEEAAGKKCEVVCLQELFYGPYFLRRTGYPLVRHDGESSGWRDDSADV